MRQCDFCKGDEWFEGEFDGWLYHLSYVTADNKTHEGMACMRCRNWVLEGHDPEVIHINPDKGTVIHPSGKLTTTY